MRWRRGGLLEPLFTSTAAALLATALALVAIAMRWRGSDLPAQVYRIGLIEEGGLSVWSNYWFGGHHTLGYGLLLPVLGAVLGMWTVAVVTAAVSSVLADLVIRKGLGRRCLPASLWFAAGTLTNVAVGRLSYALGMMIGLAAILAAQHRRVALAALLTVATAMASPVVSVFLAIAFAAWFLTTSARDRRIFAVLTVAAVSPLLVVRVLYPQGGMYPFRWFELLGIVIICGAVAALAPAERRFIRVAAGLYVVASLVAFVVPTPLGGNITRLMMYAGAPVVLAVIPRRRALLAPTAVLLGVVWVWQWSPSFDAIIYANSDPSTEQTYYAPLRSYLRSVGAQHSRVEIVPMARHWEAAFVAREFPLARGWERQLDIEYNPEFYGGPLNAANYRQWLNDAGVGYVALADVRLDPSGVDEAALIETGLPYLQPVWSNENWRVWKVKGSQGIIEGPAEVVSIETDELTLRVTAPGDVIVRVRESPRWSSDPAVCIEPTDDGWIVLRDVQPGTHDLYLDEGEIVPGDPCAD